MNIKCECGWCGSRFRLRRKNIRYWPDHLWVGKIQACYQCPKCKKSTWRWAHKLPTAWQEDVPCKNWENYCLPRLHESLHFHNIEPIPGQYPTSKYWKQWQKENGFPAENILPDPSLLPLSCIERVRKWLFEVTR